MPLVMPNVRPHCWRPVLPRELGDTMRQYNFGARWLIEIRVAGRRVELAPEQPVAVQWDDPARRAGPACSFSGLRAPASENGSEGQCQVTHGTAMNEVSPRDCS